LERAPTCADDGNLKLFRRNTAKHGEGSERDVSRNRRGPPDLPPGPARELVHLFARLRHAGGMTNQQVAARVHLSQGHVSDVLNGWKGPGPDTAAQLAAALGGTAADALLARSLAEQLAELNRHHRQRARRDRQLVTPARPGVHLRLLGPVSVEHSGQLIDVGGATARAVLALLALRGAPGASTEEIIEAVWDGPGRATRNSVHHYVSALRSALRPAAGVRLQAGGGQYQLLVDADSVDWHRFRGLVAQGRTARGAGDADTAAALLRDAVALWRGPPLTGVGTRLEPYRRRMVEQRLGATELLAEIEAARGRPGAVVDLLLDELPDEPIREHRAALLVDALAQLGRRDEAGAVYHQVRARLRQERGLEPAAELAAAHRRAARQPLSAAPAPRPISGLPRVDPHFTDRVAQVRRMVDVLSATGGAPLCVVHGMGGAGKTALAAHVARSVAGAYPDGLIFIDLLGYTEDREPLTAADALDRLLRRMRVDGTAIPADTDERAAFYRDHLADRRLLIVLDNARDAAQVRPLLPGGAGCGAIVTSRLRLAALDDATPVPLDVFDDAEALLLFRAVVGEDRLRGEPEADGQLSRIVAGCGRIPLAVRIAAGNHRAREQQRLSSLELQLNDARDALQGLRDDSRSLAATLRVSLAGLPADLSATLALLAGHPGTSCDVYAATALCDLTLPEAQRHLGILTDRHLVVEQSPGRYRFHDLVGAFVRQHVPRPEAHGPALARLVDHYLRAADRADRLLTPHRHRVELSLLDRADTGPDLPDYAAALAWLTDEQGNLADACVAAGAAGLDVACWQLAFTLRGYYFLTKDWKPWTATYTAALAATQRLGDVLAEALITNNLGLAHLEQGHDEAARRHYERAGELFGRVGDVYGEHTARANLAWLAYGNGRYAQFLDEMRPVLSFYQDSGAARNAAITRRGIGLAEAELGNIAAAVEHLQGALADFERLDLPLDVTMTWNAIGETHQKAGDPQAAGEAFRRALASGEASGSRFERARARHRLGELAVDAGDVAAARAHLSAALDGYRQLDAPHAAAVRRALDGLPG
jgi:DNA-binding SARP family transcriptional activator/plasmid maintenance system antidote protein VapI